jgi:hypothetical protein
VFGKYNIFIGKIMPNPSSGPISFNQLNLDYNLTGTAQVSLGGFYEEILAGNSGTNQQISMNQFYFAQSGTEQTSISDFGPIATSANGNTLAVGNENFGANIYTRSSTTWSSQSVLAGTGGQGSYSIKSSVALSADGNTLAVGYSSDNTNTGAVWIWTRSGSTWTQQGSKLVGSGAAFSTSSQQGTSVALSADGNTLAVGASGDNSNVGAVWIWTRSGSTWTQQGSKLVGTGYTSGTDAYGHVINYIYQGTSVALSADGNTLAVGGPGDNSNVGAVWIWTRSGSTWTQQGSKLVGTGYTGTQEQGTSVALSADGNTLAVGAPNTNTYSFISPGVVWVFSRNSGVWGSPTVVYGGTSYLWSNVSYQGKEGTSVALSADGNILITGAPYTGIGISKEGSLGVYTRTSGSWTSLYTTGLNLTPGSQLQVGKGCIVSGNGNTIIGAGAFGIWVFV